MSMFKDGLKGAIVAVISSLLLVIIFSYLFRFPIPLIGMIGPFGEISVSYKITDIAGHIGGIFYSWVFFGIFGGFILFPLLGAITGVTIGCNYFSSKSKNKFIILWSALICVAVISTFSISDCIFGKW